MAETDGHREKRAARNQSLFREVNERVLDLSEARNGQAELTLIHWLCECADQACVERIALSLREYETLRETPTRFAIAPSSDHFDSDVERVVKSHERYWVVEKQGLAASVAEELDPRS